MPLERPSASAIEPVGSAQRSGLTSPPEEEDVVRVLDLESQEEADRLDGMLAAIDVVAEKQIAVLWG